MPQDETVIRHLRIGICDDKCRVMEAKSGCMCAEAADVIERLTSERDEWKHKWMAMAQASLLVGTMKLPTEPDSGPDVLGERRGEG